MVSRFARPALARRTKTAAITPSSVANLPWVGMDGHAPTLELAQAQLAESWRKWLVWAKLAEIAG